MEKQKPKILVLASGTKTGGGSGFQELVEFSRTTPRVLEAEIVAVVSNHQEGGVHNRARELMVPFEYWPGPFMAEGYQRLVKKYLADFVMCSGWLKYVRGLDPRKTVNIHPGPLPEFGGQDMYGHHVHEAVIKAYREGKITQSAATMHFVTEEGPEGSKKGYDKGPIILQLPVLIRPDDTAESLGTRVNEKERALQALVLNWVVHGFISMKKDSLGNWRVVNCLDRIIPH